MQLFVDLRDSCLVITPNPPTTLRALPSEITSLDDPSAECASFFILVFAMLNNRKL